MKQLEELVQYRHKLHDFVITYFMTWMSRDAPFCYGDEVSEEEAKKFDEEIAKIPEELKKVLIQPLERPATRREHQLIEDRFLIKDKVDREAYVKYYLAELNEIGRGLGKTVEEIYALSHEMENYQPVQDVLLRMSSNAMGLALHSERIKEGIKEMKTWQAKAEICYLNLEHSTKSFNVYVVQLLQLNQFIPFGEKLLLEFTVPKGKYVRQGMYYGEYPMIPSKYEFLLKPAVVWDSKQS